MFKHRSQQREVLYSDSRLYSVLLLLTATRQLLITPVVFIRLRLRARLHVSTRGVALLIAGLALLIGMGTNLARPAQTAAATSNVINFQARLEDISGAIVPDGYYDVQFKLYNAVSSGTLEWTENWTWNSGSTCAGPLGSADCRVQVINGYLTANLGAINAFSGIDWSQQQWLTMNIGGTVTTGSFPGIGNGEMSPRLQLTAVPYAFQAGSASTLQNTNGANVATLSQTTPTHTDNILLPDDSGTVCLQTKTTCGFESTTGTDFIQNQNITPQTGANFNIAGSGTLGGNLTLTASGATISDSGGALTVDAAGALNLGSGTATSLTIGSTANNTQTLFKQKASTTALQVLPASGSTAILDVDSTNNRIGINTNAPGSVLDVQGIQPSGSGSTTATTVLNVTGGKGQSLSAAGTAGIGAAVSIAGGSGGDNSSSSGTRAGGAGGGLTFSGGTGGQPTSGSAGNGGGGGSVTLQGGAGGGGVNTLDGGNGGNVIILGGTGGAGGDANGAIGTVQIQASGGATTIGGALTVNGTSSLGNNISFSGTTARTITGPGSGGLTVTSAGALTLTGAANSTWDLGASHTLFLQTSNGAITTGAGLLTVAGTAIIQGANALTLGTSSNNGALLFASSGGSNKITLQAPSSLGSAYALTLPTTAPGLSQCLQNDGTTVGQLIFNSCGSGSTTTLQGGYTASTGGTTPEIILDTTRNGIDIQDKTGGSIGSTQSLLSVRGVGTATTLGASLFTVNASGQVAINNGSTSATPTISYDLSFGQGANRTIGVEAQGTAATAGNNLTVSAGAGNTTGGGGTLNLQGGAATATAGSAGGGVAIAATNGTGTGTGGVGGAVTITGGNAGGTGANNGGNITLTAGRASATGTGTNGSVIVKNVVDSTAAFQVQNASTATLLNVDTTNSNISLLGNTSGNVQAWQTNSTSLGTAMINKSVILNGYIYSLSDGFNRLTYYAKINANGSIGSWTATTLMPNTNNLSAPSVVAAGNYIYVIGGRDESSGIAQAAVYSAKQNTDGTLSAWTTLSATPLPDTRWDAGATVANGYIYVVGGYSSGSQDDVYYAKYNADGTLEAWTKQTAVLPANQAGSGVAAMNGYIYSVGGFNTNATNAVYHAPLNASGSTGTWVSDTNLTAARDDPRVVVQNGYIYAVGGNTDTTFWGGASDQSSVYYAQPGSTGAITSWSTGTSLLDTLTTPGVANANGYIYVLGGYDGASKTTVYYASGARVQVGASLDLVGLQGGDLNDIGAGGSLTAGNTNIIGALQVQGQASFSSSVAVAGNLSVNNQLTFGNSTNSNGITLLSGTPSASYSLTLPTAVPSGSGLCLQSGTTTSTTSQLAFGSCGTGGGGGLAKNATDTSSFAVTSGGYLYQFTNSSSAVTSGVLKLDNGTNTNSTLTVTASGNPASGQALIFASNTNASASGNLIDLQSGSSPTSKFSVTAAGAVTASGSVTIASGQSYTSAGSVTFSSSGANAVNIDTGGAADINIGASNASSVKIGKPLILTGAGNAFQDAQAPTTGSATTAIINLGASFTSGTTSGTFIGVGAASGFAGDLINMEVNGTIEFSVDSSGGIHQGNGVYVYNTGATTPSLYTSTGSNMTTSDLLLVRYVTTTQSVAIQLNLPSASSIVAAIPRARVGDNFTWGLINNGSNGVVTIGNGTGSTISASYNQVPRNNFTTFLCHISNVTSGSEAVTCY
jgi:hypothetical protein